FLYSILALAFGSALAQLLARDPGYVLINFRGTTIEVTLATLITSVVLLVLLGFAIVWLLRLLNPRQWFRRAPAQASAEGLQLLLLGRWQEAYKILVETADRAELPALYYM